MFILRTQYSESQGGDQVNLVIGSSYTLTGTLSKTFEELARAEGYVGEDQNPNPEERGIFAFLTYFPQTEQSPVSECVPLFKDNSYFIMTGEGNTFEKLRVGPTTLEKE